MTVDIGKGDRPIQPLQRSKNLKDKTMFNSLMKTFDRISLTLFLALAATPMLAVAVNASIH